MKKIKVKNIFNKLKIVFIDLKNNKIMKKIN